jgi:hypothetical protein
MAAKFGLLSHGRRYYGRERAGQRLDLHDPVAADCAKAEEKEALKAKTEAQASPRSGEQRIAAKAEQFDYESRHVKR